MRCPTLAELPPPPPGRVGWPWTAESPELPGTMPDGRSWPRISIVTPSYNQGPFIEEAIRSVLLQGYPDLEYIIMDGGSTDGSAEIIRKYQRWLTHWESGPDGGQSAAINAGLTHATGEWANWLNSDDMLALGALSVVGERAARATRNINALSFSCQVIDQASQPIADVWRSVIPPDLRHYLSDKATMPQPSTFIRRSVLEVARDLHFSMDWVLHFTLIERHGSTFFRGDELVSYVRAHAAAKTYSQWQCFFPEQVDFVKNYRFRTTANRVAAFAWRHRKMAGSRFYRRFYGRSPSVSWCLISLLMDPWLLLNRFYLGALRQALQRQLNGAGID